MNENQLLDAMSGIDPTLLRRSECQSTAQWKKLMPVAACLCLILGAAFLLPRLKAQEPAASEQPRPLIGEATVMPDIDWTATYNTSAPSFHSADRAFPLGFFTEELSDKKLQAVLPQKQKDWMVITGRAGFTGDGALYNVVLAITTQDPQLQVQAVLGNDMEDYILMPEESAASRCGELVYVISQVSYDDGNTQLYAAANIGDVPARFSLIVPNEKLERAKTDFEAILECFAWYAEGKPELSAIKPDQIPDWYDRQITWAEASADEQFGDLWLTVLPAGFTEESIRRHKDMLNDYLSGLWTKGLDQLSWRVWYVTEEDQARMTSVADKENYDLSLYPIPRAESVPEALFQVVNDPIFDIEELTLEAVLCRAYTVEDVGDSGGVRMMFSVRYGDKLVSVSTKGVDPQWLYEQLKALQ